MLQPDPRTAPDAAANKTIALCDIIRQHHVIVLTEKRTNELDRLMTHLHSTHKLVHVTNIAREHVGRRGFGVAFIAANACVDCLSLYAVSPSLQCVWVRCDDKALIGFGDLVCTAYINPQSQAFTLAHVTDSFSSLLDELACATQVAPYFLLCGDFNPKVGGLSEVPHAHGGLLMAHPALQLARRCECRGVKG